MILINEPRRQNDILSGEITGAIRRVLDAGMYCLGEEVEAFESEFVAFCGAEKCIALNSGTDALELALRALDIAPGDRVATVANAGGYSSTAIRLLGATPVYVEIDSRTLNMDPGSFGRVADGCKAVIVTHLYGRMAPVEDILRIANDQGVAMIEDCAQAHGAARDGRAAGTFAPVGCYSFYPTKNLGALGDSGAVITSDPELAGKLLSLRQYGWASKYESRIPGGRNSRMDSIQAAVLRAKLPHLRGFNTRRREIASAYISALAGLPGLVLPPTPAEDDVCHLFTVRHQQRDRIRQHLLEAGVASDIHYPVPDYRQPGLVREGEPSAELPVTEQCCAQVMSLPCYPELTRAEIDTVVRAMTGAMS